MWEVEVESQEEVGATKKQLRRQLARKRKRLANLRKRRPNLRGHARKVNGRNIQRVRNAIKRLKKALGIKKKKPKRVKLTYLGYLSARYVMGGGGKSIGAVSPTLGRMTLAEAEILHNGGIVGLNREQFDTGVPSVIDGLLNGSLKYIRRDPNEKWQSAKEIWISGGGDCEDLASAVAAEIQLQGIDARMKILRGTGRIAHAVVETEDGLIDPSVAGGMPSSRTDIGVERSALRGYA